MDNGLRILYPKLFSVEITNDSHICGSQMVIPGHFQVPRRGLPALAVLQKWHRGGTQLRLGDLKTKGCWTKNRVFYHPKSSILNRVFHEINHPFWDIPIFWKHPNEAGMNHHWRCSVYGRCLERPWLSFAIIRIIWSISMWTGCNGIGHKPKNTCHLYLDCKCHLHPHLCFEIKRRWGRWGIGVLTLEMPWYVVEAIKKL